MMKQIRFIFMLFVSGIVIVSVGCEKDSLSVTTSDVPVVEAYLQPNQPITVRINKQIQTGADTEEPIDNLQVIIKYNENSYALENQGNGIYTSDSNVVVAEGRMYELSFEYQGATISAATTIPSKPNSFRASASSITIPSFSIGSGTFPDFPDPIKLYWNNPDKTYYLVVVENIESNPEQIFDDSNTDFEPPTFRIEPDQSSEAEIGFNSFSYYGRHNVILYHINAEYAALYRDSGTSSQNISNPPTNITNGLGIFTGVNADTLQIQVK